MQHGKWVWSRYSSKLADSHPHLLRLWIPRPRNVGMRIQGGVEQELNEHLRTNQRLMYVRPRVRLTAKGLALVSTKAEACLTPVVPALIPAATTPLWSTQRSPEHRGQ